MDIVSDTFIKLTSENLYKMGVINSAYEDTTSKGEIIEAGINMMFAHALEVLYQSSEISDEGLEMGLNKLPDYLKERVIKNTDYGTI